MDWRVVCVSVITLFAGAARPPATWAQAAATDESKTDVSDAAPPAAAATESEDAATGALDPVVVTATPYPQPQSTLGSGVTVLDAAALERQGITEVRDALETAAGLFLAQTGPRGSATSLFLRGGESNHTLVLIDGIPVNQVGGGFDFGSLTTDNVERIEVVRGAQSAVYGADAMSGVINIVTKRGSGPPTWSYDLSGGTRDTFRAVGSVSGSTDVGYYSASVSRSSTGNREDTGSDGYKNWTASARGGLWLGDDVEVEGTLHAEFFNRENRGDNRFPDDIDDESDQRRVVAAVTATHHITDTWEHRLRFAVVQQKLSTSDDSQQNAPGAFTDAILDSSTRLKRRLLDYRHTRTFFDDHVVTVGFESERERGTATTTSPPFPLGFGNSRIRRTLTTRAVYAQVQSAFLDDTLNIQAGIRVDDNSSYGTETSPRLAGSYLFRPTNTRVHASYGEGINNPSIFDLDPTFGGNPNLEPEEVENWDVGVEQRLWNERGRLDVTYFEQDFSNLIDFSTGIARNLSDANTSGVEVSASAELGEHLTGSVAYTFLETEDDTGADLLRRPKHSAHGRVTYKEERWYATVTARWVGDTPDALFDPLTFATTRLRNDGYTRINLASGYNVTEHMELYGRIENLLNDHYETVAAFETVGITVIAGIRGQF